MIKVCEYQPAIDLEARVYCTVRKAKSWRVEMHVERPDGSIERRPITIAMPATIREVHALAVAELADMTAGCEAFTDCGFALWAQL